MLNKSEILENRLLNDIQSGVYLKGQVIPSRNWLAQHYDCSRTTVERAVNQLIAAGFLAGRRGSGTYVRATHPQSQLQQVNMIINEKTRDFWQKMDSGMFFFDNFKTLPTHWLNYQQVWEQLEKVSTPGNAVIWHNPSEEMIGAMDYLHHKNIPQLLLNRTYRNYDCIYTDPASSIREGLAWLLIEAGREIALVSQKPQIGRAYLAPRLLAFYENCVELGAKLNSNMLFYLEEDNDDISREISAIGNRLFAPNNRPRGIFVPSQEIVLLLIRTANHYNLRPGQDFFLLTFDYVPDLAALPGVAMLRQPYQLMLREAQRWLQEHQQPQVSSKRFEVPLKTDLIRPEN